MWSGYPCMAYFGEGDDLCDRNRGIDCVVCQPAT